MATIVWFRRDLRLSDNPALSYGVRRGPIVPLYVADDKSKDPLATGSASDWWLHHSLSDLRSRLGGLVLEQGDAQNVLTQLVKQTGADCVVWNRLYEPNAIQRDKAIKTGLRQSGIDVRSFNASLLVEPWQVNTKSGGPFKVYSAFWRTVEKQRIERPLAAANPDILIPDGQTLDLPELGLLPTSPNWASGWSDLWQPGEAGARAQFEKFLDHRLEGYATLRDRPDLNNVSRLSAHLHFGEISVRQVWAATKFLSDEKPELRKDIEKFLNEIGWREFCHHLLYHFPDLPTHNWRPNFDHYPWRECEHDLTCWQRGLTGYPFVDAGMRELWATGYLHNRARMVSASFLVKHLRLHWRHGEAWFRDTLVDADLANNAAGWQWVAGCGADAAPYFRIFNPVTQGRKFDPDGDYVRRWCPELAGLDTNIIHAPFEASKEQLANAGVELGVNYPEPIVEHKQARASALAGYEKVKEAQAAGR